MRRYRASLPHHARENAAWLADLRWRRGRTAEARRLLEAAEPEPTCRVVRAALAFAEGDFVRSADHARAYLRLSPPDRHTERIAGLELLFRSEAALGRVDAARVALADMEVVVTKVESPATTGSLLMARGSIELAASDAGAAGESIGDAASLFERGLAPFEAAQARIELGRVLELLDRRADGIRSRARGEEMLRELRPPARRGPLTASEVEVVTLVAEGISDPEIAARLVFSVHTVRRHLANVMRKLDVVSRTAVVVRATELGLI
jgi:ATP/maltotriose-dependent transcriptional regulator MalT